MLASPEGPRTVYRMKHRIVRAAASVALGLVLSAAGLVGVTPTGIHPPTPAGAASSCLPAVPCFERIVNGELLTFSWSEVKGEWGYIGYTVKRALAVPSLTTYTYPGEVVLPSSCYDDPGTGLYELRNGDGSCGKNAGNLGFRGCWNKVLEWFDPSKPWLPCLHVNAWSRSATRVPIDQAATTVCGLATGCPGGHSKAGYYWAGHSESWDTLQWGWVPCRLAMDAALCPPSAWKTPVTNPPITLRMQPRTVEIELTPSDAVPVGGAQRVTTATSALTIQDCTLWVTGTGVYDTGPAGITVPCSAYPDLMPRGVVDSQQLSVTPVGITPCAVEGQADGCYYWVGPERRFSVDAGGTPAEVVQRKISAYRASGPGQGIQLATAQTPWQYEWATQTIPTAQCEQWHAMLPPDGAHPSPWQMDFPVNPDSCTLAGGTTPTTSWARASLTPTVTPAASVLLPLVNPTPTPTGASR